MAKVLVILAEGFEEVEALSPVDLLRRAGADVTVAGLDKKTITSSRNITVVADALLEDVASVSFDAVIIPGGMPGAANLASSKLVNDIIKSAYKNGKIVAAICASPAVVLGPLGILEDNKAVCYPGMEERCKTVRFVSERDIKVLRNGNIITARGAGCAFEFGLEIVESLFGKEVREKVAESTIYR